MRVRYVPITEKEWLHHIQRGAGFSGTPYQRGAGLGSLFRSLFRAILPLAKTAGRAIGKQALKAGAEVATDLVAGKNLKQSLEQHGKEATADLLAKASKKLKGGRLGTIKGKKPKKAANKTVLGVVRS